MNAGPISNGVSHESGNAFRAGLEATDLLADLESCDHGSPGSGCSAVGHDLHVHAVPSTMHPQLARVTQTILTKNRLVGGFFM